MSEEQCYYSQYIICKTLPVDDIETENIKKWFDIAFNFIDNNRQQTNVLINCYSGRSRSPTILIAYIMKKYNENLDFILLNCRLIRPEIYPNPGFYKQLREYEKDLFD